MPTTDQPNPLHAEIETLGHAILHVMNESQVSDRAKPFAALAAARHVCECHAKQSEEMRARLAKLSMELVRALAPEFVIDIPEVSGPTH